MANMVKMKDILRDRMRNCLFAAIASLLVISCSSTKNIAKTEPYKEANNLAMEGRYAEAMLIYETDKTQSGWDSATWRLATIAASKTGRDSLACIWGAQFPSDGDTIKLQGLIKSLKVEGHDKTANQYVATNLEICKTFLGDEADAMAARHYAKTKDEALIGLYPTLATGVKSEVFSAYLTMERERVDAAKLETICKEMLKDDKNNIAALSYLAKAKYEKADGLYKKTVDGYNKNKTQVTYAYMRRDMKKIIEPLYKESRGYYERLSQLEPENKNHIQYLININSLLGNTQKVNELKKKL